MSKTVIVLNMSGGLVQDVFCSDEDAHVIVVDWDCEGCDLQEDGIVEVSDKHGRSHLAYVAERELWPINELTGTDAEAAIQAAGLLDA